MFSFKSTVAIILAAVVAIHAEQHTVHFDNRCGYGTPTLIQGGNVLSTGGDYTAYGPLYGAIAYLQTGNCGFNGEGCTLVETTLVDSTCVGCGSSTDISLIPLHAFSVPSGFGYYNGCDGSGADCTYDGCLTAFYKSNDNFVQVGCQANDVNLAITFCD